MALIKRYKAGLQSPLEPMDLNHQVLARGRQRTQNLIKVYESPNAYTFQNVFLYYFTKCLWISLEGIRESQAIGDPPGPGDLLDFKVLSLLKIARGHTNILPLRSWATK